MVDRFGKRQKTPVRIAGSEARKESKKGEKRVRDPPLKSQDDA